MPASQQKPKSSSGKNRNDTRPGGKAAKKTPGRVRHNNPLTDVRLVAMNKGMFVNFSVGKDNGA